MKICPVCGKEFIPTLASTNNLKAISHQKYCSCICRFKANAEKNRERAREQYRKKKAQKPIYEKDCICCGTHFTTRRPDKIYCSHKCNALQNWRKYKPTKDEKENSWDDIPNVCCICGREIPDNYTVCFECSLKSTLNFESKMIFKGENK